MIRPANIRNFMVRLTAIALFAGAAHLACGGAPGTNLVTNGDFETGPYFVRGAIPGWTISGTGNISANSGEGYTDGSHVAALDEGGSSQGNILSQTITTVPGQAYIFEFDGGVFGSPPTSLQLRLQALGNTSLLDETVAPPVFGSSNPDQTEFHHFFRMFTADSTSTTIRFTDIGTSNAFSDVVIDAVSVVPMPSPTPAPTPTTLPLVNADFEAWPFNYPGVVSGWTIGGNMHIEALTQGATSPDAKGHSAGLSVGTDSFGNILSQTFNTVPNQTYTLDFDAGVYGQRNGSPLQMSAQIIGSSPFFSTTVTPPEAGTYHPVFVTFQHYHFSFIAGGTLATVQFTDLVGNNGGADIMLDTVSILPQILTFLQWQAANFTVAQQNNAAISGWTADPDADGIGNGLEYYFHMNPMAGVPVNDQSSLPQTGLSSDGGNTYATFSYHRLLGWTGNSPVVAVSTDLVNWDTSQTQIEQVGSAGRADGFTDVVTVRLKTPITQGPIPRVYFRLMLTQ
jgi:hypothetical protein